jgi:hypothetical protein
MGDVFSWGQAHGAALDPLGYLAETAKTAAVPSTASMQKTEYATSRWSRSLRRKDSRKPILCSQNYNIWAFLFGDPQGRIPHIVGSYARAKRRHRASGHERL